MSSNTELHRDMLTTYPFFMENKKVGNQPTFQRLLFVFVLVFLVFVVRQQ